MAGFKRGKIPCGMTVTQEKMCQRCKHRNHLEQSGYTCSKCGEPLKPWCEVWVTPGDRCRYHMDEKYTLHPDAPRTPRNAFERSLTEEEAGLYAEFRTADSVQNAKDAAAFALVHAMRDNGDRSIQAVELASKMLLNAARLEESEARAAHIRQSTSAPKEGPQQYVIKYTVESAGTPPVIEAVTDDDLD